MIIKLLYHFMFVVFKFFIQSDNNNSRANPILREYNPVNMEVPLAHIETHGTLICVSLTCH